MSKPSIEKIVFNVRGKKLELSSEEAKELKGILEDLFGHTEVIHKYEYQPCYPYRPWTFWSTSGTLSGCGNTLTGSYSLPDGATSNGNFPNENDTLYLSVN